ncbi:hypothetical protein L6452_36415 [Arctium lappa]|uniref:Uncharacterized protein n=1 Tax=Arctium lappa TaxID=4217 RepID=A0ACB8YAD4_ARCLA|nr:hypothetical protein L6452_36415 [Arctium lappa]
MEDKGWKIPVSVGRSCWRRPPELMEKTANEEVKTAEAAQKAAKAQLVNPIEAKKSKLGSVQKSPKDAEEVKGKSIWWYWKTLVSRMDKSPISSVHVTKPKSSKDSIWMGFTRESGFSRMDKLSWLKSYGLS